jgi:hypothetical protein
MEKSKTKNHRLPSGTPLTDEELAKQVKEAQKGPFYTSTQVKQEIKKWKNMH